MASILRAAARPITLLFLLAAVMVGATVFLSPSDPTSAGGPTFTVNNTAEPGNGPCDLAGCTLREAMNAANGAPNSTIAFDIDGSCSPVCTITPASALPILMQPGTRIDATTQPGFSGTPIVVVDGTGLPPGTAGLSVGADFVGVKSLVIRDFSGNGIETSAFVLDGLEITDNRITNNDGDGILLGAGLGVDPVGHDILRNTITDNGGTGINNSTNCMENALIAGNTITGHIGLGKAGIELCGGGDEIHFNRIVGNTVGIRDHGFIPMSNVENNWWGCNEGPTNSDCDSSDETDGATDYDPWLVLEFAASPSAILTGETSILGADLRMNSGGADTSGSGYLPDNTEILFQTDLGSVGSPSVVDSTVSGLANATLTADAGPGTAHVSAELDNEVQTDQVTITEAPPPTPTPEPTETPTPTPTPTPEPTPEPTPTPTPTPTASPIARVQGDVNCDGSVTAVDSLGILRFVAGLPALTQHEPCPDIGTGSGGFFGDLDCKNLVNSVDALGVLRLAAGLPPLAQQEPCTDIGATPATGT